jgi:hypothetical protein
VTQQSPSGAGTKANTAATRKNKFLKFIIYYTVACCGKVENNTKGKPYTGKLNN